MGKKKTVQLSRNDAEALKESIIKLLSCADPLVQGNETISRNIFPNPFTTYEVDTIRLIDEFNRLFQNLEVNIKREVK